MMKPIHILFSFLMMMVLTSLSSAEERKMHILKKNPIIQYVPTTRYQWQQFQDVEILPAHNEHPFELFALRTGEDLNTPDPNDRILGLWQAVQTRTGQWQSQGTTELTRYIKNNFNIATHPAVGTHDMTACKDEDGHNHIFIQVYQDTPLGSPSIHRLLYVFNEQGQPLNIKLSSALPDDMGESLTCMADKQKNVHLFSKENSSHSMSTGKIVYYSFAAGEGRAIKSTLNFRRILLPDKLKPRVFTIYKAGKSLKILYDENRLATDGRGNNWPVLSLARKSTKERGIANLDSGWEIITDSLKTEDHRAALRQLSGFTFGDDHRSHILGLRYSDSVRADPVLRNGITYFYEDTHGHWKSNGFIFRKDLDSISATALDARLLFHIAGITQYTSQTQRGGEIWYGYLDGHDGQWKDKGIIFRTNSY